MNIHLNTILKKYENKKQILLRVIWINDNRLEMYLIDIDEKNAVPFPVKVREYEDLLEIGAVTIVEEPYYVDIEGISDKSRKVLEFRVPIINKLLEEFEPPIIFDTKVIWKKLEILESELNCTANAMKKILRLYWQRGLSQIALIPNFGRKRIVDVSKKELRLPNEIMHEADNWKKIILSSFEKYYNKKPLATLEDAYKEMLEKHFTDKVKNNDDTTTLELKDNFPSYWRFEYITRHLRGREDSLRKRWGDKKFNLQGRYLEKTTEETVKPGPGTVYQIDATVANVYIRSSVNRDKIIGRPVLYFVTDSFSRLITGMYSGLEGPSWNGAMMALVNCTLDKVAFCSEYGIDISKDEWASSYLPIAVRGDRGELISKKVEELIRLQGVRIDNTPPFRADLKAIVERKFGIIDSSVKPFLPGYVDKDFGDRGAKDYRIESALTLKEFNKIIIYEIIQHNKRVIKKYRCCKEMMNDDLIPTPNNLWSWGIKNRSGSLKVISEKDIKLTLLPSKNATVTSEGLRFNGMFYTSNKALKEEWFSRARTAKNWIIKVRYDERNTNYVYYWDELTNDLEPFRLKDFEYERYGDLTFQEVALLRAYQNYQKNNKEKEQLQNEINTNAKIRNVVKDALIETANSDSEISKKDKTDGIRGNRANEKEINRRTESFVFDSPKIYKTEIKEFPNKEISNDSNDKDDLLDALDDLEKEFGW